MAYLPSLPGDAVLLDVFRAYPDTARPLLDYHQALLRGPSPLSVAERELIAAFVSGLNACGYCHGVHTAAARSSQILTHVAGTWALRSPSASMAQYGHPGRQYTSTPRAPVAGLTAPLPGAATPQRNGDCLPASPGGRFQQALPVAHGPEHDPVRDTCSPVPDCSTTRSRPGEGVSAR